MLYCPSGTFTDSVESDFTMKSLPIPDDRSPTRTPKGFGLRIRTRFKPVSTPEYLGQFFGAFGNAEPFTGSLLDAVE